MGIKKRKKPLRENQDGEYEAHISYEACETSYEEGELPHGKSFNEVTTLCRNTIDEIFYDLNKEFGTSLDIDDWDPYDEEEGILITDSTTNSFLQPPTAEEIEKFRNGDINLYDLHIWMEILDPFDNKLYYDEIKYAYNNEKGEVELSDEEYDEGFDESQKRTAWKYNNLLG